MTRMFKAFRYDKEGTTASFTETTLQLFSGEEIGSRNRGALHAPARKLRFTFAGLKTLSRRKSSRRSIKETRGFQLAENSYSGNVKATAQVPRC